MARTQTIEERVREAEEIIRWMSEETFGRFQAELQYAVQWHHAVSDAKSMSWLVAHDYETFRASDGYHERDSHSHLKIKEMLKNSLLYSIIREEITKRKPQEIVNADTTWLGWCMLDTQEDVSEISGAIDILARSTYPIGMLGMNPRSREIKKAKATLNQYGLKGIFLKADNEAKLMNTFLLVYAQK